MTTFEVLTNNLEELSEILHEALSIVRDEGRAGVISKKGIIISGAALIKVFESDQLEQIFNEVAQKCEAVLCCRVTPL